MKGFIYIIRSHQTDAVYYGSTIQMLCKRMAEHRRDYKRFNDGKYHYTTSFDIVKYDDAYIELVEEIEFQNKQELFAREGHYIRDNKCVNKNIPCRTDQQYRKDNRERLIEKHRQYNDVNKDKIKQYAEANKERIKEYKREWYQSKKNSLGN
jgi:hypothetical protein